MKIQRYLTTEELNTLQNYLEANDLRFGQFCALFGNGDFYTNNKDFFEQLKPTPVTYEGLQEAAKDLADKFAMSVDEIHIQLGRSHGMTLLHEKIAEVTSKDKETDESST